MCHIPDHHPANQINPQLFFSTYLSFFPQLFLVLMFFHVCAGCTTTGVYCASRTVSCRNTDTTCVRGRLGNSTGNFVFELIYLLGIRYAVGHQGNGGGGVEGQGRFIFNSRPGYKSWMKKKPGENIIINRNNQGPHVIILFYRDVCFYFLYIEPDLNTYHQCNVQHHNAQPCVPSSTTVIMYPYQRQG